MENGELQITQSNQELAVQYDIVFDGKIAEGQDPNEVKKRLAAMFKMDLAKIEQLFAKAPVTVRKNVDFEEAAKYWDAFEKAGAVCRMEPLSAPDEDLVEDYEEGKKWYG